jgi:hypothetical protein
MPRLQACIELNRIWSEWRLLLVIGRGPERDIKTSNYNYSKGVGSMKGKKAKY